MKIVWLCITWFIAGSLYFLINAQFGFSFWDSLYYIWDAAKDLLLVATILNLIPKQSRWIVKPVFYYSIIRLLWEIIAAITKWDINHPQVVTILFLVLATGMATLLLKDLIERWKQNSSH